MKKGVLNLAVVFLLGCACGWFAVGRLTEPIRPGEGIGLKGGESSADRPTGEDYEQVRRRSQQATVEEFVRAFNEQDIAGMLFHAHPEITWLSIEGDTVVAETVGRDALRDSMAQMFAAPSATRSKLESELLAGGYLAARERAEWNAGGTTQSQAALAVYQFEDAQIRRVWYFPSGG